MAPLAIAVAAPAPNPVAAPAPQSTDGLLSKLSDLESLLSEDNINNLNTIIGNAAKLLSDDNLKTLQSILTNANSLLTPDFVDNTTTLIGDATPVSDKISRFENLSNQWPLTSTADRGRLQAPRFGAGLAINERRMFPM